MIIHMIKESSIDYSGEVGPILFTAGCNFHCGFCHNALLNKKIENNNFIDEDKIIKEVKEKALTGWYTGICISGGEPLLHGEKLKNFILKLKSLGLKVKLDTNGTNPNFLKELVCSNLVDYVAMDIKGSRNLYEEIVGAKVKIEDIEESIRFLLTLEKNQFEFRTTIPLIYEENEFRFMNEKETEEMGKWIFSLTGKKDFSWNLQAFIARTKDEMNDEKMSLENLPKEMHETSKEYLEKLKHVLDDYCDGVRIR